MPKTIPFVMVSSTSADLETHRDKTRDAILRVGWYPEMMEHDGAAPEDALQRSLRYVAEADVYILILGFRYGSIPDIPANPDRLSYTELEYRRALERQSNGELVILSFLMDEKHPRTVNQVETDPEKLAKLNALRAEVSDASKRGVSAFFGDASTLYAEVLDALHKLSKQTMIWQDAATPTPPLAEPPDDLIEAYFAAFAAPFRTRRAKDVADIAHADLHTLAPTVAASLSHISLTSVGDDVLFADDDEEPAASPVEPEGDYQRGDHENKQRVLNVRRKLMDFRRGVLLGQPGGGKTWTLTMLLLDYCDQWRAKHDGTLIPVFVPLNSYRGDIPFADFVRRQLGEALAPFYDALAYRLIYLCDALNEMPDQPQTLPQVKGFLRDKPHFIVSCRVLDYQQKLDDLRPLEILNLRDLDLPAIKRLLATYVPTSKGGDLLWQKMGGSDELLSLWAKMKAADAENHFWDASQYFGYDEHDSTWQEHRARTVMHSGGRLIPLCRSPFMASSWPCTAFLKNQGELPSTRGGLFESFITSALEDQARRDPHFPDLEAVKAALVRLAEAMQSAKVTVLPRTGEALAADAPLIDAGIAASILTGDRDKVRFQHQLFQEYFATRILLATLEDDETNETNHAGQYFEPHWWEAGVWRETVVILGELAGNGASGANRAARWLAPVTPELALTVITENGGGLTLADLDDSSHTAVLTSAHAKTAELNLIGRAAAYRVLGLLHADDRPGIGIIPLSSVGTRHASSAVYIPDIAWCPVPAGPFFYGDDKQPITIDYAYEISKYPVTNVQFQPFVESDGYTNRDYWTDAGWQEKEKRSWTEPRYWRDSTWNLPNHPVVGVSWYEAYAYTQWLSYQLGYAVHLPTEGEWERAARGTDGRVYPWGDEWGAAKCNNSVGEFRIGQTSAVGIFSDGVSPCGAMDMAGNVWEWCLTRYEEKDDNIEGDNGRVLRGGSWSNNHRDDLRAAYRYRYHPDDGNHDIGFRLARSLVLNPDF